MTDYKPVKDALAAGTPPELVCAACPWDRLCITPPTMTSEHIDRMISEAEAKDKQRDPNGMPTGMLMTALTMGGRDTAAQCCPVFTLKLRGPDGRTIADGIRSSMRGE